MVASSALPQRPLAHAGGLKLTTAGDGGLQGGGGEYEVPGEREREHKRADEHEREAAKGRSVHLTARKVSYGARGVVPAGRGGVEGDGGCSPQLPVRRGPQSVQSSHGLHVEYSPPSPPSSQSPSAAYTHVSKHRTSTEPGGAGGGGDG